MITMSNSDSVAGSEALAQDVRALCTSVRTMKGHLTRRINSATKALGDAGASPSSHAVQELMDSQTKIQEQYSRIEGVYTQLMDQDEANYSSYDKELTASLKGRMQLSVASGKGLQRRLRHPDGDPALARVFWPPARR